MQAHPPYRLRTDRPPEEGRCQTQLDTFRLLEELDIPYAWLDHEVKMTIADCADIDEILAIRLCKNLFLTNKTKDRLFLLLMPGDKPFVTRIVSKLVGSSRLEFAPADLMERHLNLQPGSVSVMGLLYDREKAVELLIDREVLDHPYVGLHPCVNTTSFRISREDFQDKLLPALGHTPLLLDL